MPAKKKTDPPNVQGERFKADAQRMMDAGELSPTEADAGMDKIVKKQAKRLSKDA